jgi:RNA polymerase sigma factor (sigma-70 family)
MMTDMDDMMLLQAYAEEGSEEAFATLVSRHLNLVYCAALRRTRDPQLAEDITQVVFFLLARKARSLRRETILSGWLYRTTRYTAGDVLKSEFRRRRREQEAQMESPTESDANETIWQSIAPVLDDAIGALGENDRNAIILRFFENRTFKQVGLVLGLNEDTARLRVSRAVEKLRSLLMRRNVMVPEMMLAGLLTTHAVTATAPGALASSITAASLVKGAAASGRILTLLQQTLKLMAWTKIKTTVIAGTLALLTIGTAWQKYEIHRGVHGLVTLHVVNAPLGEVIHNIERQSGQAIAWERRLDCRVTIAVNGMPLPQVLNQLNLQAGSYWTVDYAVYDSEKALGRLATALHGDATLNAVGWTNLSSGKLDIEIKTRTVNSNGSTAGETESVTLERTPDRGFARIRATIPADSDLLKKSPPRMMTPEQMDFMKTNIGVVITPESPGWDLFNFGNLGTPGPQQLIDQAIEAGTNDGVLAPERMLAEIQMLPMLDNGPVPATPEKAQELAKKARASWAVIYTLRQSPVEHLGLTLFHLGEPAPPVATNAAQRVQEREIEQLILTPEQRAAHARTFAALKQQHQTP